MKERNVDRYSALAILAICLLFVLNMRDFGEMGGIFPKYVIILLAFSSVALLIKSLFRPERLVIFNHKEPKKLLLFLVILLLWVWLFAKIGFVVSCIIFYFVTVVFLDEERKTKPLKSHLLVLGIISLQVLFFYYAFEVLLNVPLPHGIIF